MASGHTPTNAQLRRRFQRGLQILLDTFYDTILLYAQDIQVVNFSDVSRGFVIVITYVKGCEQSQLSTFRLLGKSMYPFG